MKKEQIINELEYIVGKIDWENNWEKAHKMIADLINKLNKEI